MSGLISVTVQMGYGEMKAYVSTWRGQVEVPFRNYEGTISLCSDFNYEIYKFDENLVII